jgi:hypothetical protein
MLGLSTPRQRLEWASDPTSRYALAPHPHAAGGSGNSTQSHGVSSPAGWSITATGRPLAGVHGSHAGRRPRARRRRVNVGYDRSNPSSSSSSNRVEAHTCRSSTSRAAQYVANGSNQSGTLLARTPGWRTPVTYARIVLRSRSSCRAIAEIVHPRW